MTVIMDIGKLCLFTNVKYSIGDIKIIWQGELRFVYWLQSFKFCVCFVVFAGDEIISGQLYVRIFIYW